MLSWRIGGKRVCLGRDGWGLHIGPSPPWQLLFGASCSAPTPWHALLASSLSPSFRTATATVRMIMIIIMIITINTCTLMIDGALWDT